MIKKILVPIDGSENSDRAVSFAAELAVPLGATITLLHVLDRLPAREQLKHYLETLEAAAVQDDAEIESVRNTLSKSGEDAAVSLLETATRRAKAAGVTKVTTAVEDGDPAKEILKSIESRQFDIVVMGRRGLGGLKGMLMGSLSQKVANLAECTVVTVK